VIRSWLHEIWEYRELLYFLVWRDLKVRYKQTAFGAAWALLQPVCMMLIMTIVFGRAARVPSDGLPYPIFFYSALLPWLFFASAVVNSSNSLVGNSNLLTKVYFPRVLIPASAVISGLVDFAIAQVLLIGMLIYYGIAPTTEMLAWPVLILVLLLLSVALALLLSVLNVQYRDVKYVIPFAVQIGMFVTPVIYPLSIIPEKYRGLASLNPLAGIIEGCRAALLPTRSIEWSGVGIAAAVSIALLILGVIYFRRAERTFADVI
jgi:lipopolysaccharide transport system permease protein